jgi:3-hydroxyisobutyrate dehydrogenase-like beta-hydroxyacid dehydrogenase
VLGEKGGVDWDMMIDIMKVSAVGSPLVNYKADALKRRDFRPVFSATQMAKDFDFALDVGREVQAPMQITALVRQHFTAMQSSGRGEWDLFGYVDLLEEISGLKRKPD